MFQITDMGFMENGTKLNIGFTGVLGLFRNVAHNLSSRDFFFYLLSITNFRVSFSYGVIKAYLIKTLIELFH